MADKATVTITGDEKGLKNALGNSHKMLKNFASQTASVFSGMALFSGIQKAASMIGSYLHGAVDAAAEAERAMILLDQSIKNTGNTTGFTRDQLVSMSKVIQETTTFTDEAALAALTMIKNFENIRGDELKRTLKASADLAESLGVDLPAAAKLAARAVADPAKGAQMLARATKGVAKLTEEQKKLIESFVAVGDTAAAQGVVLDMLEHKFGGLAEAIGQSTGGQLKIFQNQLEEIQESVGAELLPEIQKLMPELEGLAEMFGDTMIGIMEVMRDMLPGMLSSLAEAKKGLADLFQSAANWYQKDVTATRKDKRRAEIEEMKRNPITESTPETLAMELGARAGGQFDATTDWENKFTGSDVIKEQEAKREKRKAERAERKAKGLSEIEAVAHEKGKLPTAAAKGGKGDVAGTFEDIATLWKRISTASHTDPAEKAAAAAEATQEDMDEMVAVTNEQTGLLKEQNAILGTIRDKFTTGNLANA